jgi:MYXO-CTERM domain-containing protein
MKRTLRPIAFLPPLLLAASLAQARGLPHIDAYYQGAGAARASRPSNAAATRRAAASRGAVVSAIDARRGVPSFVWAAKGAGEARGGGATPAAAAKAYLERFAPLYGLSGGDAGTARVTSVHDTGAGAIVVSMRQQIEGVEIFRSDVKLLLTRGLDLFAISGSPQPAAGVRALAKKGGGFRLTPEQALASAFGDLHGLSVGAEAFAATGRAQGAYRYYDVRPAAFGLGAQSAGSPRAKPVYFALPDRLVPAYYLELEARGRAGGAEDQAYGYVVAADDGRVLYRNDLIAYDSYSYKVFAHDDAARHFPPADGPLVDHTPFPAGAPIDLRPDFVPPVAVSIEGFNQHGDPWLPPGAAVTSGNNVDAYADHDEVPAVGGQPGQNQGNDPPQDVTPDPTAEVSPPGSNAFPYAYDTAQEPLASDQQIKAAVTQLFYTTNWLHDYWYDSGFDEAAGVAQNSNFGRVVDENGQPVTDGEGDAMEAQAQDKFFAGFRDNANMSTPADGAKPRMQMFVSKGRALEAALTSAALPAPGPLGFSFVGPKTYDLTAGAAVAFDGGDPEQGSPNDACEPISNAAEIAGKVAILDEGPCDSAAQAVNAQQAGAAAVVIAVGAFDFRGGFPSAPVTIPVAHVNLEDALAIRAALEQGPVNVTLKRRAEVDADGTIDNGTIAHEWGHYWHHRLVSCGSDQCRAMSEGWGDFVALHMIVRPGDALVDTTFNGGDYGDRAFDGAAYFGVRRYPYSTSLAKNPLTFRHVANQNALPPLDQVPHNPRWLDGGVPFLPNAEPHCTGEWWAVTLFEAYVGLLQAHSFDEAKRRMADYLVGGMKLTAVEPTFVQQRDAILAYVYATDKADYERFVAAFVKRGLGVGAKAPPLEGETDEGGDSTFNEAVENFDRKGELAVDAVSFDEAVKSCDGDGVVDADEIGQLVFTLSNVGMDRVTDAAVEITTAAAGVELPGGAQPTSVALDPYGRLVVRADVAIKPDAQQQLDVTFDVKVKSTSTFTAEVPVTLRRRVNLDEKKNGSNVETVEASEPGWKADNLVGPTNPQDRSVVWGRFEEEAGAGAPPNHRWHGDDQAQRTDGTLESPDIVVGAEPLSLEFEHRYSFEFSAADGEAPPVYWDGGVIEVGEVTGAGGVETWSDISAYTKATGYDAPGLGLDFGPAPDDDAVENPLLGRPGFGAQSAGFDEGKFVAAKLDFGTALAGKTVRFRFRIGSDASAGEAGWDIDNLKVTGATIPPFVAVVDDAGTCAGLPLANAGADQTVDAGAVVTLDASTSSDPDGDTLTYAWEQLEGPEVTLQNGGASTPTFTAPNENATLVFRVRASDGKGFATDTVNVQVVAQPGTSGASGASGAAGSDTGGASGTGGAGGGAGGSDTGGSGGASGGAAGNGTAGSGTAGSGTAGSGTAGSGTAGSGTAGGGTGGGTSGSNPGNSGRAGNIGVPGDDDDDGCDCSTAGSSTSRGAWLPALAAGLAALRRRRRRSA